MALPGDQAFAFLAGWQRDICVYARLGAWMECRYTKIDPDLPPGLITVCVCRALLAGAPAAVGVFLFSIFFVLFRLDADRFVPQLLLPVLFDPPITFRRSGPPSGLYASIHGGIGYARFHRDQCHGDIRGLYPHVYLLERRGLA